MRHFIYLETSSQDWLIGVVKVEDTQLEIFEWCDRPESISERSSHLFMKLQQLLDLAQLNVTDIEAVAFGQGPGAFTGLRTACSLAQGLCFALDIPAIAVNGFELWAQSHRMRDWTFSIDKKTGLGRGSILLISSHNTPLETLDKKVLDCPLTVLVTIDARMSEVYWQAIRAQPIADTVAPFGMGWVGCHPPKVTPINHIAAGLQEALSIDSVQWVCGNVSAKHFSDNHLLMGVPVYNLKPSGFAMAYLAWIKIQKQQWCQAREIHPLYVRNKVAQTLVERSEANNTKVFSNGP